MKSTNIHDDVAKAYTEALNRSRTRESSCCSPATSPEQAAAAAFKGYAAEREKYTEAAASSFGCGNPLAFAGVQPGQTVLDLGSGAGFDLLIAADKVGEHGRVIGVDMTDAMIEAARQAAAAAGKTNVEVRKGLIEDLPVQPGEVDWVISNCVINLSPDKPAVFAEVARVLRPGGKFSIQDIVVDDLPAWIRSSAAAYSACVAGAISESEYLAGLRAAGLGEVEVAERLVYSKDQIIGMLGTELNELGIDLSAAELQAALDQVEGKIWSAKFVGEKPPA